MHRWVPPSVLIPSHDGLRLLDQLASNDGGSSRRPKTTTPAPPQPVLWFPNNNADCGGSTKGSESIGTFSLLALLLSVFNIINLVASNVNNNNNRNNINDNSGNLNTADNTESNANSGSETATMVMMVPPGVGRRKRDLLHNETSTLVHDQFHLKLGHGDEIVTHVKLPSDIDQYYMDEYDQYAEGNYVVILCEYSLVFTCFESSSIDG